MEYKDFELINGPIKTTINGIVPDKITELDDRWLTSTQENNTGKRETYLYTSYDKGNTWNKKILAKFIKEQKKEIDEFINVKKQANVPKPGAAAK